MNDFQSVLGHEGVKHHLMTALGDGLLSHAYIIEGPRGVGKRTLTRAFVRALLCEDPIRREDGSFDSCGHCRCCELLDHGNHPDVKTIRPRVEDGKQKPITVDQIRDELVSDIQILPYMDSYKIYIIEEADKLNVQAQNAMLKTIEEPPAYGMILLLAESDTSFLATILSRCVKIPLSPLPSSLVVQGLTQNGVSADSAQLSAAFSQGSLGEALKLCEDETFASLRRDLFDFLASVPQASPLAILKGSDLFDEYKASRDAIFSLMNLWYRDVAVYRETKDPSLLLIRDRSEDIENAAAFYSSDRILTICDQIAATRQRLQANVNAALAIDCLLITLK